MLGDFTIHEICTTFCLSPFFYKKLYGTIFFKETKVKRNEHKTVLKQISQIEDELKEIDLDLQNEKIMSTACPNVLILLSDIFPPVLWCVCVDCEETQDQRPSF